MKWWELSFKSPGLPLEDASYELSALATISGITILESTILCYFRGTEEDLGYVKEAATSIGLQLTSVKEVPDIAWTQLSPDVWEIVRYKNFTIVPIRSDEDLLSESQIAGGEVGIIPGAGFGTGHHATTKMMMGFLDQMKSSGFSPPEHVLDIGTGSGILSIVCARLWGSHADGTDIDTDALNNAAGNAKINKLEKLVRLSNQRLHHFERVYHLVLANIYTEVLLSMQHHFLRLTQPGSVILVSGVKDSDAESIRAAMTLPEWRLLESCSQEGWCAMKLVRER